MFELLWDQLFGRRYDNEAGKGDHRHLGEKQSPYIFTTPAQLLDDFWHDVDHWRS